MSADEGTIQDNNLGQSSLEPTLQKEQESESRHEEEKGMGAEPVYSNDSRRNSKRRYRSTGK